MFKHYMRLGTMKGNLGVGHHQSIIFLKQHGNQIKRKLTKYTFSKVESNTDMNFKYIINYK